MQGYPFDLPLTEYPRLAPLVTDTASPQQCIPVYYIHSLSQPFCGNPLCRCHRQQQEIKRLLGHIVEGIMTLREAADLIDEKKGEGER
ncbi:MAG TPA: hypothetical protein VK140_02765 [Ktedonobacteraceae bacterium]|nr:hypothetical protein [Ktedonobacteraceae bacterium]